MLKSLSRLRDVDNIFLTLQSREWNDVPKILVVIGVREMVKLVTANIYLNFFDRSVPKPKLGFYENI